MWYHLITIISISILHINGFHCTPPCNSDAGPLTRGRYVSKEFAYSLLLFFLINSSLTGPLTHGPYSKTFFFQVSLWVGDLLGLNWTSIVAHYKRSTSAAMPEHFLCNLPSLPGPARNCLRPLPPTRTHRDPTAGAQSGMIAVSRLDRRHSGNARTPSGVCRSHPSI